MGTSWRDLEWNWRYVGYDWRHPTYPSRLAFSGFGLLTFGLLETLILGMWIGLSDVEVRGVGTMVAGLIVIAAAFVLDRLQGRTKKAASR